MRRIICSGEEEAQLSLGRHVRALASASGFVANMEARMSRQFMAPESRELLHSRPRLPANVRLTRPPYSPHDLLRRGLHPSQSLRSGPDPASKAAGPTSNGPP